MRISKLMLVAAVFAVLTSASAASPAAPLGGLDGQVELGSKPVAHARVTLQEAAGRNVRVTETDGDGYFQFSPLRVGLYDLRAYSHGRVSEWRQNVLVTAGHQTSVTLRLGQSKGKASP